MENMKNCLNPLTPKTFHNLTKGSYMIKKIEFNLLLICFYIYNYIWNERHFVADFRFDFKKVNYVVAMATFWAQSIKNNIFS